MLLALITMTFVSDFAFAGKDPNWVCRTEADTLCAKVSPGGGRVKTCLLSHKDELSEACLAFYGAAKPKTPKAKTEAKADENTDSKIVSPTVVTLEAEKGPAPEKAVSAATNTIGCYLETDSRKQAVRKIEFDAKHSAQDKAMKIAALPANITISLPLGLTTGHERVTKEARLTFSGGKYGNGDPNKGTARYIYASRSLEVEASSGPGADAVLIIHNIPSTLFTNPPRTLLDAAYEFHGLELRYSCKPTRNTRD